MRIDVLTLFPEVMQPYVTASILGRAQSAGIVEIHTHQLRDFSQDPHKKVDDRPFGGGPGMILTCQPVVDAVEAIEAVDPRPALRVLFTPQGRTFNQQTARRFASRERLFFICGHYEGCDERIVEILRPEEISLGDFVLTGGEIAALAVMDSVVRLLPGALGHDDAADNDSFQGPRLEHPQYTRPREFRGRRVPDVLLGGNHAEIDAWRRRQAQQRTQERRPDLLLDHPGGRMTSEFLQSPNTTRGGAGILPARDKGRAGILPVRNKGGAGILPVNDRLKTPSTRFADDVSAMRPESEVA